MGIFFFIFDAGEAGHFAAVFFQDTTALKAAGDRSRARAAARTIRFPCRSGLPRSRSIGFSR